MRRISLPELRRLGGERWAAGAAALAQLPTVPTFQELRPAFEGELRRARRYERPLAVLALVPDVGPPPSSNGNGVRAGGGNGAIVRDVAHTVDAVLRPLHSAQLRFLALGSLLCGTLRESDVVSYAADLNEFIVLLPECGDAAARRAVGRLDDLYSGRLGIGLRAGTAVYPANGLTLDDLVAHARQGLAAESVRCYALANRNGSHNGNSNGDADGKGVGHGNGRAHA